MYVNRLGVWRSRGNGLSLVLVVLCCGCWCHGLVVVLCWYAGAMALWWCDLWSVDATYPKPLVKIDLAVTLRNVTFVR
jgi:hypothetical protein